MTCDERSLNVQSPIAPTTMVRPRIGICTLWLDIRARKVAHSFHTNCKPRYATGKERMRRGRFCRLTLPTDSGCAQKYLLASRACNVPYEVISFDEDLYHECIDDARRHGYPVDGDQSGRTFLREGVVYAATAGMHLLRRPTQIWIALYTSCAI